MTTAN